MKYLFYTLICFLVISGALAENTKPLPRFVSLRSNEVNLRVGPGSNYPIAWVYVRSGLPVEIIAEFDTWRKIRDPDEAIGWVHQNMLTKKRHVRADKDDVVMYRNADTQSVPLARLQKGVILDLIKTRGEWCHVKVFNYKGWVLKSNLWGVYAQEKVG